MLKGTVDKIVGQTPLIYLKSLSEMTGCHIYGKAEFLNPGGSVKDRAALGIILEGEKNGILKPGSIIVEGTAGNTGIGLATLSAQRNYHCKVVMPDNQAREKYEALASLGAELIKVPACPFANQNHFYHTAKRLAESTPNAMWANQFENTANFSAHYQTTGPEIWEQMNGTIDAFVSSVGTGGTIAGVSRFLKEKKPQVHIRMVDPMGSGLYSYFKTGNFLASGSSITEGIGIMRLTANFKEAVVDEAVQVNDVEMISMLYHVAKNDGLLVGTSAALNLFGAYKFALENKASGKAIVTILCDSGARYHSKIFNPEFLAEKNLVPVPLSNF